ncbi:hypothetical protein A7P95_07285 [Eikenella longinqua]|uniref:Uncharacterized protein n=1 Tax=Eikenella longinqua TaxID=1795827 RepID=A0A1A9RXA5_9NEIS|nr:hypothetical protein [Eikenella longinqua]OAM27035.1 hypothetical protein A7P95_07285 [Eikenella longinqua]
MDSASGTNGGNALLKKWDNRVARALKNAEKQHKLFGVCRDAVDLAKKNTERKVNPYLIFSTLSALIPALYAKNPEIEIRPGKAAVAKEGEVSPWLGFAQTAEELLQHELVLNTDLKRRMKSCLLSTLTTGTGWLKLILQDNYREDPLQHNRLPDAQDNVAQLDALKLALDEAGADKEAVQQELAMQTEHVEAALRGETELYVQKGLVLDRIASENMFVLDDGVRELGDYLNAQALGHRVWMTAWEYKRRFAKKELPQGARLYGKDKGESSGSLKQNSAGEIDEAEQLLEVWEVWDKSTQHVYTFARGASEWAREPYRPQPTGERWYPFFLLAFNAVDGRFWPLSDVQTLIDYQDEYSHLRSQVRNSRQYNKPVWVVPKAGDLSAGDSQRLVDRVRDDETGSWVAASINPAQPIANSIQQFPLPEINQALFDPSMVFRDVEMTTRSGDAARGYINKAKTATEAEIMSMGMQSGISERQDTMEDLMREMARYALEILVQSYSPAEVAQILGAQGNWQNLTPDVAFRYLAVDIKAGSMSKPNKYQERDQWLQLMPVCRETIGQMAQLQMQGQNGMAGALRKMLEETLNRFDERIDLDEFIPDMTQDMMRQQIMQAVGQMMPQAGIDPQQLPNDETQQPTNGVMQ